MKNCSIEKKRKIAEKLQHRFYFWLQFFYTDSVHFELVYWATDVQNHF